MDTTAAKTLAAKIAAATKAVGGRLAADKRNREQGYDYVSADKILAVAGQALAEQGIVVLPAITQTTINSVTYTSARGNAGTRYDARVDFSIRVTDGDCQIELPWIGAGSDYAVPDKAVYKAITSGHRYFLAKLLAIGEGNEDGEHETPLTDDGNQQPYSKPQATDVVPKCPICQGPMRDNRDRAAEGRGPAWVCKAGRWNPEKRAREGCPGVYWPGEWPPLNINPPPAPERHDLPATDAPTATDAPIDNFTRRTLFALATEVYGREHLDEFRSWIHENYNVTTTNSLTMKQAQEIIDHLRAEIAPPDIA